MRSPLLLSIAALCVALGAPAAQASASSANPRSDDVVEELQSDIRDHGYSPQRLLALGRVQLEAGQTGAAVASFERGLLLAPRDASLQAALTDTRRDAGLPASTATRLDALVQVLSLREWAFVAAGGGLLAAVCLVLLACASRLQRALLTALAGSTLVGTAGLAAYLNASEFWLERAIVRQPSLTARQSPFEAAEPVFSLRAGAAVQPRARHGAFVLVSDLRGQEAWVPSEGLIWLATAPMAAR